jgi:hypothetical protein
MLAMLRSSSIAGQWMPSGMIVWRCDLAAIHERDDKVARRELNGARFQVADFKLQSAHSMRSARDYDSVSDGE